MVSELKAGTRFDPADNTLKWSRQAEIEDQDKDHEIRTMEVILAVANSIDPDIQLTLDTPSMNQSKKLPCLDLQLWVDQDGVIQF